MANGRSGSRRRRPQLTGPSAESFFCDASEIDDIAALMDKMGEAVRDAIRPVAQAGAQVLYDRVKLNVAGMGTKTGNLQSAIYQAYMKESSVEGKSALYRISWNVTKAPHGRLLEYGWIQRYKVYMGKNGKWYTLKKSPLQTPIQHPGKAFIRRAGAAEGEAIDAMKAELQKRFDGLYYGGA